MAGGSHSDIPMILAAKNLGYWVITSGNNPLEKGHLYSNQYAFADFSNPDQLLKVAVENRIDCICSSSNDFSLISSSFVAERMGLPGFDPYETAISLHHKDSFRAICQLLGMSAPKSRCFDKKSTLDADDLIGLTFPLVVKPVDLTGGKGISIIASDAELPWDLSKNFNLSKKTRIVVEEYFEGDLHSYSTLIKNKQVIFEFLDNEYSFLNPFLVATSSSPAFVSENLKLRLRSEVENLCRYMNLVDGLLHAQFLSKGENFIIIEFTRRCPGDLYSIPATLGTGVDYAKNIISQNVSLPYDIASFGTQLGFYGRHCAMPSIAGEFVGIELSEEIRPNIVDFFPLLKKGDVIQDSLKSKAGIFITCFESRDEMINKTSRINELIAVHTL